ncbi:MAG TPA: zinc ribbon domain-containing protein [Anaerolineales bacterium]|nr:zinc ribbon domain-containing protein [Anaerolineales bacterium]
MSESYCGKCGNAVQPKDRFCRKCGASLGTPTIAAKPAKSAAPVQELSSQSTPLAPAAQQQTVDDRQQLPAPQMEGGEKRKGTPFTTGLLIGGASGFALMFIAGVMTIPTMLGLPQNSTFSCIVFLLAIGAAYGAGQWGKHFAKAKGLAQPSAIGQGTGGVLGGLIGAIAFSIIMVTVILTAFSKF